MMTINVELKPHVEKSLKYIISQQTKEEDFFQDFILYKILELKKANSNIKKDMRRFERKYKLSSNEFYAKFEEGKFGDEDDFMLWSGIYELYQTNSNELSKIQW